MTETEAKAAQALQEALDLRDHGGETTTHVEDLVPR
jgi:hypothetical protein